MGDSVTAGQHVPAEQAWPQLLTGCDVAARGVSGDTTRRMLERFPTDVQELAPDVVLLQAGHNDCNRWETDQGLPRVSLDAYVANVREMIARCRTFGAEPVWFTAVPSLRPARYEADLERYNRHAVAAAREEGAYVVGVRHAFTAALDSLLLPDGLHLNAHGHVLYAKVAQAHLDRALVAA